ncbi:MAG TPA: glycosyltransferase family 4 protein [Solirubrobacteraceae bacterium]|jgi:glycosyltransferase involved in cell wall biosynthesis|nr:glycosyltransferase family 4 protein [Solirubrobacteraceae bacterium]
MSPIPGPQAKPVLFVTGHAPAYRVGALARLHELEGIELALFGGRLQHGGADFAADLPFPHRHVRPHELCTLAAGGRYRAVVCPTGGRVAPLATWAGARRARVPLILWASLWAHPRSAAHALTYVPLRRLYRSADAVVTYGPHVSAYVSARGAGNVHVARQSVDNDFWRAAAVALPADPRWPADAAARFLFVGRPVAGKGVPVLLAAWRAAGLPADAAALVLAGVGVGVGSNVDPGRSDVSQDLDVPSGLDVPPSFNAPLCLDPLPPEQLRDVYAACDVLVVPSVATRTFREPWGLVVNEAMNQGLAVIATDAVGAAAGGLVRDGANGLEVPAGDVDALAGAIERLAADPRLRRRMGDAGAADVLAYSHEAWAQGFSRALASVGVSRRRW